MQHTKDIKNEACTAFCGYSDLASSKSLKNKSAVFSYFQWKKYDSFARLLSGKMKQQIVAVVAEKLCLHRCMILPKSSNSCLFTHCCNQGQVLQQHLCIYVHGCIACEKCTD